MPTTSEVKLTRQVSDQKHQINRLNGRLSDIVDEIHLLKNELTSFKEDVAHDVRFLTEKTTNKKG
tara:strand:+ start:2318 stop:2512 length:195 start_codon:yes stop_codon:yes gene_type:complete